jgi:hypothetical protein
VNQSPMSEYKFHQQSDEVKAVPWWRVSVMWVFFVGGLGGVVVASFALLTTAITHRDTVVPHDAPAAPAAQDAQDAAAAQVSKVPNMPNSPAMQARNHAATPAR